MSKQEALKIMYAIELLEYYNANWLSSVCVTNPKVWSERKQALLREAIAKGEPE